MKLTRLIHLRPEEIILHKPPGLDVPVEMIPTWIAMAIPIWMVGLQGLLAGIAKSIGLSLEISIFFICGAQIMSAGFEYYVLSKKKYTCNPFTTVSYWWDKNKLLSVFIGNSLGWLGAITDPVDLLAFASGGKWLAADLVARGIILIGIFGLFNWLILIGSTEALGKRAKHFLKLIGHPHGN
jgi:hypothetical protein